MVQPITPELEALLKDRLQVGDKAFMGEIEIDFVSDPDTISTTTIRVQSFEVSRSVKSVGGQLDAKLPRDEIHNLLTDDAVWMPNNPVRAYAWYGDRANRVQVFVGMIDRLHDARHPSTVSLKARSRIKWLMAQKFIASAPQSGDDAVETEDNGVYVDRTIDEIVIDILDRAGWPAADRDIGDIDSLPVPRYELSDDTSWAEQIAGAARLTDLMLLDFWDDELGIVHLQQAATINQDLVSEYEFEAGVDTLRLDYEGDDEERITRTLVTGPMTQTNTAPAWREEWATTTLTHPVGVFHDAADADNLNVLTSIGKDRVTLRQSDRAVIRRVNLPLAWYGGGMSGDPSDSSIYWVLDSDWPHGGSENARIVKFDKATNAILDTYALPDGQWTDIKSDGSFLWLTRFDTDQLQKRDITDGSHIASFTYGALVNPTGMYLDGTTIGLFFNNGTKFHLVSTAAPGTITDTQSTKGTHILGGEIDATDGDALYAVAEAGVFGNSAGYVWKFGLTDSNEVVHDVTAIEHSQALEDALGFQSGIADRVHDLHPEDDPHPFEIRPLKYTMKVVETELQAGGVAALQQHLFSQIRRVLDLAVIGNPAIQINSRVTYTDAAFGVGGRDDPFDTDWVVDAYVSALTAEGSFITSMSLLPFFPVSD